jgi:hypothetical protein
MRESNTLRSRLCRVYRFSTNVFSLPTEKTLVEKTVYRQTCSGKNRKALLCTPKKLTTEKAYESFSRP